VIRSQTHRDDVARDRFIRGAEPAFDRLSDF
jgi:hypothetical protein